MLFLGTAGHRLPGHAAHLAVLGHSYWHHIVHVKGLENAYLFMPPEW